MVNPVNLETEQKLKACCKVSAWGAEPGASKLVVWREIRNKGDLKKKKKKKREKPPPDEKGSKKYLEGT